PNLSTAYGRIEALKGISLTVPPGQVVALLGANGAGKTTTLKSIAGLLTPQSGSIHLEGQPLIGLSTAKVVRKGVSLVPQERELFPGMSVIDNLMLGGFTRKDSAAVQADLDRVLQLFPVLGERRRQAAGTLSGGERQMLAIGRALMARPKLLLLDEPSLGVAPLIVKEIFAAIGRINREGTAILLVAQLRIGAIEDFLAVDARGDVVPLAGHAAEDAPRRAVHALGLDVDGDRRERTDHLLGAQAPALASRPARILSQSEALEQDRVLGFELLAGAVVRVAVVRAHHAAHAV